MRAMNETPVNPNFFIRSFFVVAFHYVLLFLLLLLGMLGIAWLGFPDIFAVWTDKQLFQDTWDRDPMSLWPASFCWSLVGFNVVLSFLVGVQVAWWAPVPKAAHGIFLAIICIVSYLQIALTQENVPKALIMALLITTPVFVVYGSRVGERLMIGSLTNANEDDANG